MNFLVYMLLALACTCCLVFLEWRFERRLYLRWPAFPALLLTMAGLAAALSGCSHITYTDPSGAKFTSTTFLSSRTLKDASVTKGDTTVKIGGSSNAPDAAALDLARALLTPRE